MVFIDKKVKKWDMTLSCHFWCRGYFVDTVGRNESIIKEYIKNQMEEDYIKDQMTLKEYIDPFTGSKNQ